MTTSAPTRPSLDFTVATPRGLTKKRRIIVVKINAHRWSVWWRRERAHPVRLGEVQGHWNCNCKHPCGFVALDVQTAPGYDRINAFRRYVEGERPQTTLTSDAVFASWVALGHLGTLTPNLRSAVDVLATLRPRQYDPHRIP